MDNKPNSNQEVASSQNKQQGQLKEEEKISIDYYKANPMPMSISMVKVNQPAINSPRSLKAMRQLGYTQDDFNYLSFKDFISYNQMHHNDIRNLSPQLQQHRYEVYNELRLAKINQVAELRDSIPVQMPIDIINPNTSSSIQKNNNNSSNSNPNPLIYETEIQSTAIAEELKAFERIKTKNESDLITMVEYELKKQIMLKEAQQRMRKQNFKVNQFQRQTELKREQEAVMQKNRQEQRHLQQLEKEEQQRQLNAIKYAEEQQRLNKLKEEEELRLKMNKAKHEEDEQRRIAFQMKVDAMIEEKMQRANERRMQMDQKDEERRIELEKRRQMTIDESNAKSHMKQELNKRNMTNLNDHLEAVRQRYIQKQKENEMKKERLDKERENEMKQRQEEARLKAEKTKNVLERDREIQQKKLDDYNAKQQLIAMEKAVIEKDKLKQQEEHRRFIEEREQHRLDTIAKNEDLLNQRRLSIMAKMKHKEEITMKSNQQRELEQMEKAEALNQRRLLSESNIRRVEIVKQNKREDTLNWILSKSNRIKVYKKQKEIISDKKRQLKDSIARKKEEYESKFQTIFHKKDIDEKTIETIHEMFPGNEKINGLLVRLDELEKENANQDEIEREYEETLHRTLTEFKKSVSLSMNSGSATIGSTHTNRLKGRKRVAQGYNNNNSTTNKSNDAFKKVNNTLSTSTNKDKGTSDPKPNPKLRSKSNTVRAKAKPIEHNKQTSKAIQQSKPSTTVKPIIFHTKNSHEFTFKQSTTHNNNTKKEFGSTAHTVGNERYNQSGKTMQSSSNAFNEKDIEKKVDKYKVNLSKELLELIAKEKEMETNRVEQLGKAQGKQKEEMKKKVGEERALSSLRIIEKNDEIEHKLKVYEDSLRNKGMRSGYN